MLRDHYFILRFVFIAKQNVIINKTVSFPLQRKMPRNLWHWPRSLIQKRYACRWEKLNFNSNNINYYLKVKSGRVVCKLVVNNWVTRFEEWCLSYIHTWLSLLYPFFTVLPQVDEVDEGLLKQLAYNARGDICPMQGVIGGITAQEVMKVCSIENNHMSRWFMMAL